MYTTVHAVNTYMCIVFQTMFCTLRSFISDRAVTPNWWLVSFLHVYIASGTTCSHSYFPALNANAPVENPYPSLFSIRFFSRQPNFQHPAAPIYLTEVISASRRYNNYLTLFDTESTDAVHINHYWAAPSLDLLCGLWGRNRLQPLGKQFYSSGWSCSLS